MCQELPLGCLNCLFDMCCVKSETFSVVFEFSYFTGACKNSEFFTQYSYANYLLPPKFSELFELQKYRFHLHLCRLSCFSQIAVLVALSAYV